MAAARKTTARQDVQHYLEVLRYRMGRALSFVKQIQNLEVHSNRHTPPSLYPQRTTVPSTVLDTNNRPTSSSDNHLLKIAQAVADHSNQEHPLIRCLS